MNQLSSLQISCIGNGKMSQSIQKIALQRGHEIHSVLDRKHTVSDSMAKTVFECALPDGFLDRFEVLCKMQKDVVIVTTGWYREMDSVTKIVQSYGNRVIWSSNYSIGVQLYFKMVRYAARLMNAFEEYDFWGTELHHKNKVDSPSGTAWTLSQILIENIDRKSEIVTETLHRKIKENEIHFSSTRGGYNNFKHIVAMGSSNDLIEITHQAMNREGYALGAVKAAEWLSCQEPGLYEMDDFLKAIL